MSQGARRLLGLKAARRSSSFREESRSRALEDVFKAEISETEKNKVASGSPDGTKSSSVDLTVENTKRRPSSESLTVEDHLLEAEGQIKRHLSHRLGTNDIDLAPESQKGHIGSTRSKSRSFISSRLFTGIVTVTILLNAVQMGFETDYPDHKTLYGIVEWIFTGIFFVEMVCKLAVLQREYFRDGWNCMDFFLVLVSLVDLVLLSMIMGSSSMWRSLSALRMLRVLRIVKMVRLLRAFRELWLIVKGIFDSVKTIFWASALLIVLLYICGIFFTRTVGQNTSAGYKRSDDDEEDFHPQYNVDEYFGTIPRTMFTLFETAIEPLNLRPIVFKQPELFPFLLLFIFLTNFGVLNVIIGVIVENTMEASRSTEKDNMASQVNDAMTQIQQLRELIYRIDLNQDGGVNIEELTNAMDDGWIEDRLKSLELPSALTPQELFDLLNCGGNEVLATDTMMRQAVRMIIHDERKLLLDLKVLVSGAHRNLSTEIRNLETRLGQLVSLVQPAQKSQLGICGQDLDAGGSGMQPAIDIKVDGDQRNQSLRFVDASLSDLLEEVSVRCATDCPRGSPYAESFALQAKAMKASWVDILRAKEPASTFHQSTSGENSSIEKAALETLEDNLKQLPDNEFKMPKSKKTPGIEMKIKSCNSCNADGSLCAPNANSPTRDEGLVVIHSETEGEVIFGNAQRVGRAPEVSQSDSNA